MVKINFLLFYVFFAFVSRFSEKALRQESVGLKLLDPLANLDTERRLYALQEVTTSSAATRSRCQTTPTRRMATTIHLKGSSKLPATRATTPGAESASYVAMLHHLKRTPN